MDNLLYILLPTLLFNIIIWIIIFKVFYQSISNNYINNHKKELQEKLSKEVEKQEKIYQEILDNKKDEITTKIKEEEGRLVERKKELNELKETTEQLIEKTKEQVNIATEAMYKELEKEKETQMFIMKFQLENKYNEMEKEQSEKFNQAVENFQEEMARFGIEAEEARKNLEILQNKLKSMNEAIARERELKEKENFYRIVLNDKDKEDIIILKDIEKKLNTSVGLNKIIWEFYIKKPFTQMIKNVLSNEEFSGIYKITNIETGEIYIGKSTNIKKRFQEHVKSAFDLGTIASSMLHTKMKDYGVDKFTFEVLEKVSKDQLTEREKFYINFYETVKYGMNQREG